MKKKMMLLLTMISVTSYAFAADVNFDVNMKTKQGNSETSISVGNKPHPAPSTVVVKEKTVIIKETDGRGEGHHDNGKKKGHDKKKHKKHKQERHEGEGHEGGNHHRD